MSQKHLLVIGYVWPEPNSSAAGENMLNLLRAFEQANWQVTFMTAAAESSHKADLTSLGIKVVTTLINDALFDRQICALQPDVVVFDRFMIEEQFSWRVQQHCPHAVRMLNTEDLHSVRHQRQQAVKHEQPFKIDVSDPMLQREVASILRCDISLIISAVELQLLTQQLKVDPAQLLQLPLLLSPASLIPPPFDQRQGFAFIGNFRHAPNWDAVLQLKTRLWPQIRKVVPGATLSVYGAYPGKKVTDLHNPKQGFEVRGWVDDARAALSQHRLLLAPLRFGAGIKGKLLTAMQCHTPSITTPCGAEGINDNGQWPGAVAEEEQDFVRACQQLYHNETAWQQANAQGQAILASEYDTGYHQHRLVSHIERLTGDIISHRQPLFYQHLLWHHSLRATQYMGQWIEAKNRPR